MDAKKKGGRGPAKAPNVDWAAIKTEYITSSITFAELSKKTGIPSATLQKRGSLEEPSWTVQRNNISESITKSATESLTHQRLQFLIDSNRADVEVAERLRTKIREHLDVAASAAELKSLSGALKDAQSVARLALGLTTENSGLSAPDGGPVAVDIVGMPPADAYKAMMRAGGK